MEDIQFKSSSQAPKWNPAGAAVPAGPPVKSLYIHVPFCAHKCEYCAFYSAPPSGDVLQHYVQALVRELELVAHRARPQTIFFGGGTPSLLTLQQWETLLTAMRRLQLDGAAEWTVECNPATVSKEKARLLKEAGVNRISMGVQSFDDQLLDRLGRIHSREMVFKSYEILRAAGFENINIDLMFAIPGQTVELWEATIREALALRTEHLSCYEVIYEEDTPLFAQLQAGEFDVDEDLACRLYENLIDRVSEAGFHQYEVANFARHTTGGGEPSAPVDLNAPILPSKACRHNVGYWRGHDSFGLGPSASEYVDGVRSKNWSNTSLWIERLLRGQRAKEFAEALSPLAKAGELAAFGLRMNTGWNFEEFRGVSGFDLRTEWGADMQRMVEREWGILTPRGFRLSRTGHRFADAAGAEFLRPEESPVMA